MADRDRLTRRVRLADHETEITEHAAGAGPDLVCLHSLGLDRRMWDPILAGLSGRGRLVAYDLRGHGAARDVEPRPSLERLTGDLVALLDALGLERPVIAGVSLGGAVAMSFALAHPERVGGLCLICTTPKARDVYEQRAVGAERDGVGPQIDSTLARWFTPDALAENGWGPRYARERLEQASVGDFAAAWRVMGSLALTARLPEVQVPTAVVAAEQDVATPPETMREIADAVAQPSFHVLPGGGHMLALERPEAVAGVLAEEFLSGQAVTPA